jgi:hypothetical protein
MGMREDIEQYAADYARYLKGINPGDPRFKENLHPRGPGGRFAAKPGEAASKLEAVVSNAAEAISPEKGSELREPRPNAPMHEFAAWASLKLRKDGGFSLKADLSDAKPMGFMAALPGHEEQTPLSQFGPTSLLQYQRRKADLLGGDKSLVLGGWVDDGTVYLDISKEFGTLAEATKFAESSNQLGIYDAKAGKTIYLSAKDKKAKDEAKVRLDKKFSLMFKNAIRCDSLGEK